MRRAAIPQTRLKDKAPLPSHCSPLDCNDAVPTSTTHYLAQHRDAATTASASNDFEPSHRPGPSARNSPGEFRCRDAAIQTLFHVTSRRRAEDHRVEQLLPFPRKFDNGACQTRDTHAANTPASTPSRHLLLLRRSASPQFTMPMIRPASKDFHGTMISAVKHTTRPLLHEPRARAVFSCYSSKNSYRPLFARRTLMTHRCFAPHLLIFNVLRS